MSYYNGRTSSQIFVQSVAIGLNVANGQLMRLCNYPAHVGRLPHHAADIFCIVLAFDSGSLFSKHPWSPSWSVTRLEEEVLPPSQE